MIHLRRSLILFGILVLWIQCTNAESECEEKETEYPSRYPIAYFEWENVKIPMTICLWLIGSSIAKIIFNLIPHLNELFPDSALLIMIGLIIGIIFKLIGVQKNAFFLESEVFMLYLLPPLVFDAGYFMPARQFFDNFGSILCFAMIGTTFNIVAIALSLWAIGLTGLFSVETPLIHMLLFGSVAADVDPVAVIVIFEELKVNEVLFIAVFGESLLNDGVAVVLYRMFLTFSEIGTENLITSDYINGGVSFLVVAFGGIGIGLLFAFLASLLTKYSRGDEIKVLNSVFILILPYTCYLCGELFGLSSIMAIVFCGAAMRQYCRENVDPGTVQATESFIKVLSLASETVIFVFLGLSTVSSNHHWDTSFVVLTVVFCLIYRTLGVVVMCYFLNKYRLNKYTKVRIEHYDLTKLKFFRSISLSWPTEVFVVLLHTVLLWLFQISYLRRICLSLVVLLSFISPSSSRLKKTHFQGITLKPIAEFLQVEKKNVHSKNMIEHIYSELIDTTMAGMEDIAGFKGHHWIRDSWNSLNNDYLRPILVNQTNMKEMDKTKLVRKYKHLVDEDAKKIARGDLNSNLVFTKALIEHTRSRTNTVIEGVTPTGKVDFGKHMKEHHGITVYDDHDNVPMTPTHIFQETSEVEYSVTTEHLESGGAENDGYESDESSHFHERI
ncbi:Protein CBR-NHX-2 [Caenorhabditis briggsae]|uniref:Sodium/hydrogen exchanger n=1 Tax=Caenorhabditis briggsae TaxID=6238 RepID=A8XGX6_CAEBR|nr:Protein CBR-NHX-2 [Caenorhabditis briggsae]CAP31900.2 Protein CBR-NHX-2 [Caenorhabditis briggsae]